MNSNHKMFVPPIEVSVYLLIALGTQGIRPIRDFVIEQ